MSKLAQDIILRPIITENSMDGIADLKYTFEVAKSANKIEIKKAVEEIYEGACDLQNLGFSESEERQFYTCCHCLLGDLEYGI